MLIRQLIKTKFWIISNLVVVLLILIGGCTSPGTRKSGGTIVPGQMTKEELRDQLNGFSAYFKSTLNTAADEIEQKSTSKKYQMISLQMRAKMLQGLYTVSQQNDPVVAFIDTWALCMRFQIYLEDGDGSGLFGPNQAIIIGAAKSIETNIEDIGKLFLNSRDFEVTQKNITEFARTNPIKVNFTNTVVYATQISAGYQNPFMQIVSIPMAPFRGIEGVERTASAIGRFTDTADQFSDVIADLPESSRWQLLMFLYELEETEMSKSLVSSAVKLSDSSKQLADSTEQLPLRIREQLSQFTTEIDQKQANLQKTLSQAEKTAVLVSETLEKVKAGADSIDAAAKSVTETAKAWQDAAGATGDAVKEAGKLIPEQKSSEPGLSAKDIKDMAGQINRAAGEIRVTITDLKQLSGTLTCHIIEIIVAVLAAVIIYRIVIKKLNKGTPKN